MRLPMWSVVQWFPCDYMYICDKTQCVHHVEVVHHSHVIQNHHMEVLVPIQFSKLRNASTLVEKYINSSHAHRCQVCEMRIM